MLGRGRPPKRPNVTEVKELTEEEVAALPEQGKVNNVVRIRDSHHAVAKLFAMGLRPKEVAEISGYSLSRISMLRRSPMMDNLINEYRNLETTEWLEARDEYYDTITRGRVMAARLTVDKLAEMEPEDISFRELIMIHSDFADRTGYPKRQLAINVNVDFAAKLDRAVERSKAQKLKAIEQIIPEPTKPTTEPFRRRI